MQHRFHRYRLKPHHQHIVYKYGKFHRRYVLPQYRQRINLRDLNRQADPLLMRDINKRSLWTPRRSLEFQAEVVSQGQRSLRSNHHRQQAQKCGSDRNAVE